MVFTQNLTAGQISAISQDLTAPEPQQYFVWYLQNGVAENNKTTALVASAAVVLVVLLVIIAILTFCLFRKKSISVKKVAKSSILADSRLKAKNPTGRAPTANSNSVSPALKSRGKQLRPITGKQTVNQPIMLPNELQIQPVQQQVQPVQNNHTSPVMRFSVQKENSDSNFFMTQTKIENPPNLKTDQTFSNSNIPNYTADKAENVEPHDTNETKERKRKRKKHVRKEGGDDMSSDKQE